MSALNTWVDPELTEETESVKTHLDGLGLDLFRSLTSPQLKEHYWRHLHGQQELSVLLALDEPASLIPWELIKPSGPGQAEAPFWCEQFAIARWMLPSRIAELLPASPVGCVLGADDLRDISAPAEHALAIPETQLVETWQDLLNLLGGPGLGLFHWTGHGMANLENSSLSGLPIGGEIFRPLDLAKPENRRFASTGPWVFLHACSSARGRQVFQYLGGWPGELINAGCGAVLGTAWDVRASAGKLFVSALYPALQRGLPIGQAVRRARIAARQDEDPSWLAYQLYGNPLSCLDPRIKASIWTRASIQEAVDAVLGPRTQSPASWRQSYLEWVVQHPLDVGSPVIAVEAAITGPSPMRRSGEQRGPDGPDEEWAEIRHFGNVGDALREFGAMVLLGPPGSGKTTALRVLLRDLAELGLNRRLRQDDEASLLPVLIGLEDYTSADLSPLEYVRRRCRPELRAHLENELLAGRLCLLCDGLDEMPQADYYRKVRRWRNLVETYESSHFVFACRSHNYGNELHLQPVEICAWNDDQILRFLTQELEADAPSCWQILRESHLVDLARIPLLLTWIVQFYISTRGAAPKSRGALSRAAAERLLVREREKATSDDVSLDVVRAVLSEIAYCVQADQQGTDLPVAAARAICADRLSCSFSPVGTSADTVLSFVCSLGMITERQGRLRFSQRQFQEYFAAVALLERFAAKMDLSDHWQSRSDDVPTTADQRREPWRTSTGLRTTSWEEPAVLAAGLLDNPNPLLTSIDQVNPLLAGRCAADVSALVQPSVTEMISGKLLTESTDPAVPLRKRIECGHVLGRLRDPRFVRARNVYGTIHAVAEMMPVPAGIVYLGAGVDDDDAFADERPCLPVEVPAFSIGRYLVTNSEYRCFVQAGGYSEPMFWTPQGWWWREMADMGEDSVSRLLSNVAYHREHIDDLERWFREASVSADRQQLWRRLVTLDEEQCKKLLADLGILRPRSHEEPAYAKEPAFAGHNQPVVGINWYEATAYCHWLSEVTGRSLSLPSEPQWERAAKGVLPQVYPWGSRWEPDRCNSITERVLRPTPVGVFPRGRSVFNCEDMAGNVFEWTSSVYRPYPYDALDGRENLESAGVRVNRGGGWDSPPRIVRSSLRGDMSAPTVYDRNLGFRLASRFP
ncbi:SUMF1/EgtB/PvdO family nonheme iron enzyme [Frankia sp. CiP3]|uniref:SUMF1/EgtB/PvdO family nonheme iron enzyme n=1 Tax=Frankia sp. CiP3 TaxID=2880971 RepID=UPI001EF67F5C|nr:SUMF1/EgtB/PvdO family nonheme iron enzyme [Frankia sp. CiP3]